MVAADCLTLFGVMASETTWLTHILYMTTDCHYVAVQLSHLSAAPQRDDISLSLASRCYQCLHRSCEVFILAVAPCQPLRVTPCLAICTVSPPGGAWQCRLNPESDILREKLAICAHFLPWDVAFGRCARRRLAEGVIRTDNQRCPRWWRGNVPRCTIQSGDGHISVLSGALRMSVGCIVGLARLVYCCYCLTDLSKLFCGTYNIYICMMIWHLLLYSVQTK